MDELPGTVAVSVLEIRIDEIEARLFDRLRVRAAGHTHDSLSIGGEDQRPIRLTGHGIGVQAAQMMQRERKPFVNHQLLESVGKAVASRVVGRDRESILVPHPNELRLAFTLYGSLPDATYCGEHHAQNDDGDEKANEGEPSLPPPSMNRASLLTAAHFVTRSRALSRRTRSAEPRYVHRGCLRGQDRQTESPSRCPRAS